MPDSTLINIDSMCVVDPQVDAGIRSLPLPVLHTQLEIFHRTWIAPKEEG
jgi:hypothetical protein